MPASNTFDAIWESRYKSNPGYRSWYPWTGVVSFVLREAPRDRPRSEVRILEIGCGTGNNLWFVAREGFQAAGLDISPTAIDFARMRLAKEGLEADLRVGDFSSLPFPDASFDLVFERAALSFSNRSGIRMCMSEVRRVLKPGGLFQCTPYSDRDSSFYRTPDADGAVRGVEVGTITGGSQVCFFGLQDVRDLFADGWEIRSLKHVDETDMLAPARIAHCEWLITAQTRPA